MSTQIKCGGSKPPPYILFILLVLDGLLQQVSHLCRRLLLHLIRSMGVGGEGESGTAVTQHAGHGFDIDSVLQGQGCEGVPQIMEADVFQSGILEDLLMELHHRIRVVHSAGHRRGEQVGVAGMFIVFLFQKFHGFLGQCDSPHGVVGLGRLHRQRSLGPVTSFRGSAHNTVILAKLLVTRPAKDLGENHSTIAIVPTKFYALTGTEKARSVI